MYILKKKTTLLTFFVALSGVILGQNPSLEWTRGTSNSCITLAAKTGRTSVLDSSGNSYSIGYFSQKVDFDPSLAVDTLSSLGFSTFVWKLDVLGNYVWVKRIGGLTTADDAVANCISIDSDGDLLIVGNFNNTVDFDPGIGINDITSVGVQDIFVLKLDTSGNLIWVKNAGGTGSCAVKGVSGDTLGNQYIAGEFSGSVDLDPSSGLASLTSSGSGMNIFVSKWDNLGNFVWAKKIGGLSDALVNAIVVDESGNSYCTGPFDGTVDFDPSLSTFNLTASLTDIFVFKLNSSGNLIWAKSMEGTDIAVGNAIILDKYHNVYTTGWFQGTVDFDPGVGIEGLLESGIQNLYVSKLDNNGNYLWAKSMSPSTSSDNATGFSIDIDSGDNIYLLGQFNGTIDFDPGIGTAFHTAIGAPDMFVVKLNSSGSEVWSVNLGGVSAYTSACSVVKDAGDNVYCFGYYYGTVDFDPGSSISNLTSTGDGDIFLCKLNQLQMGQMEYTICDPWVIYPNPTNGNFTLECSLFEMEQKELKIYDVSGKEVHSVKIPTGSQKNQLNLSNLNNGIYFYELAGENTTKSAGKVVIVH